MNATARDVKGLSWMERLQDFWMVNRPRLVSGLRFAVVLLVVGAFIFGLHAMTTVR